MYTEHPHTNVQTHLHIYRRRDQAKYKMNQSKRITREHIEIHSVFDAKHYAVVTIIIIIPKPEMKKNTSELCTEKPILCADVQINSY